MDSTSSQTLPSISNSSLVHDPSSQVGPVAHAEKQVEVALDKLVAIGALQPNNRMDLESFLNPACESDVFTEASDEEIYQAVMDSIAARENIEINGGDDVDEDIPIEPRPTRQEVLKAASTINRYIDGLKLNSPIDREVKATLGPLSRQLRLEETKSMKNSVLTDFFQRL